MFGKIRISLCGLLLLLIAGTSHAQVVVSQVYGGGGNGTSNYKNDFIELFNRGATPVNLAGWSVQYASKTGTTWATTNLGNVTLQPGRYYLVQEAAGGGGSTDLPAPDATGSLAMSATDGKVALVSSTTALSGSCPTAGVIDLVGFGTADCHEGPTAAAAPSAVNADIRAHGGCTDTDHNNTDFATGLPTPRNIGSTAHPCGLSVNSVSQNEGDSGTSNFVFTVSLSEPAPVGGVSFDIATHDITAAAGTDYVANALTAQTIAAGGSTFAFTVVVNGDTASEPSETFSVDVTNITGVTTTSAQGIGTIVNDDAIPIALSINNVSANEGNAGTTNFVFTVTSAAPAPAGGITFDIATADGSAHAGTDYVAQSLSAQTIPAGSSTYTFTVLVNGDTVFEPTETFVVNVGNISGAGVDPTARQATGTILNDDPLSIGQIQGDGLASPYVGQSVLTVGNVVTAVGPKGFAMQDPVGDGNLDTSDGMYVFTGSAPTVHVGDIVSVGGNVVEFSNTTEFSGGITVSVTGTGGTITPIVLDGTFPSTDPTVHLCGGSLPPAAVGSRNWECIENMLVSINGVVVGATNGGSGSDGTHPGTPSFFYATADSVPRPFREKGIQYPGVAGLPVWDGDPELIEFYPPGAIGGPTSLTLDAGQHFAATAIVGDFSGTYELYPVTFATTGTAPVTVQPVPAPTPGTLTIASQNTLHFFNDINDSGSIDHCTTQGSVDTCETTAQFAIREAKLSLQIRSVLQAPAVVGVQEVENLATLQALADQIHSDDASLTYVAYLIEGNDVGGIDSGVLVRQDAGVTVNVNAVTQIGKATTTTDGCGSGPSCLLNDRPPLLLDATYNGYHFAVLVLHDRSLSGVDDPSDGPRVRNKRLEQAQYVAEIIQAWQTGSSAALSDGDHVPNPDPTAPIIVVGDYNAYEFTDGYVDVVGQIKGVVVPADNLLSAPTITTPSFCDAGLTTDPATRYSFAFDGYVQELDHALLSRVAWRDFVSLHNAHGNADTSEASAAVTDPTTAARSADHDGQVLTLAIDRIFADSVDGDTCQ